MYLEKSSVLWNMWECNYRFNSLVIKKALKSAHSVKFLDPGKMLMIETGQASSALTSSADGSTDNPAWLVKLQALAILNLNACEIYGACQSG